MTSRLKWYKARRPAIDRVLGTNGAHRDPDRYELREENGDHVVAFVQRFGPGWRYCLPHVDNSWSTMFADLASAKAAAKNRIAAMRIRTEAET